MNEPVRWRDDPDAPNELRDMLSRARPSRRMSAKQFARGSRRLAAGAAAGGSAFFWLKGRALAALLGGGGVLLVLVVLVQKNGTPPVAMQTGVRAAATLSSGRTFEQPAPSAAPTAETPPESAPVPTPQKGPPAADSSAPRDTLAEETELIERARMLLSADPNRALSLLDQHQKRFAHGKLGMERELLRVDALRRVGRTEEARSRIESLLARSKNSIYEARLRQLLAGLGGPKTAPQDDP